MNSSGSATLPTKFEVELRCFPMHMCPVDGAYTILRDFEHEGKMILPRSAYLLLHQLQVSHPMIFKISNKPRNLSTHCGVLEFIAEEGRVYLPCWLIFNLFLQKGDIVNIQNITLPQATLIRLQPVSRNFVKDIIRKKKLAKKTLQKYISVTAGDSIHIKFKRKFYQLHVSKTEPENAVSVTDQHFEIEFKSSFEEETDKIKTEDQENNSTENKTSNELTTSSRNSERIPPHDEQYYETNIRFLRYVHKIGLRHVARRF